MLVPFVQKHLMDLGECCPESSGNCSEAILYASAISLESGALISKHAFSKELCVCIVREPLMMATSRIVRSRECKW